MSELEPNRVSSKAYIKQCLNDLFKSHSVATSEDCIAWNIAIVDIYRNLLKVEGHKTDTGTEGQHSKDENENDMNVCDNHDEESEGVALLRSQLNLLLKKRYLNM